jgi:shikimate dehydrogenase
MDIYGVIGWPIKHSLSPAMHNAAFKALGMQDKAKYIKIPIKPDILEDFLLKDIEVKDTEGNSVRSKEILGFNITIPHKVKAKEILEKNFPADNSTNEDDVARHYVDLSGAVNTVKRVKNKPPVPRNTDVLGFLTSLKEDLKFNHANKNVLLVGSGGAGRAIIAGLGYGDVMSNKIYVWDKSSEVMKTTEDFFRSFLRATGDLNFISEEKIQEVIKDCHLLVNVSPVGMKEGDPSPIDKKLLHKDLYVYDVVYNRETQLVKDAKALFGEKQAVGGKGMFLYQGGHAFKFWTGVDVPVEKIAEIMKTALQKALS